MKREMHVDYIGHKKIYFAISSILILLTIVLSFVLGVQLDIEFKGGTLITYSYVGSLDIQDAEKTIENALGEKVDIRESTDMVSDKSNLVVSLVREGGISSDDQAALTQALQDQYPDNAFEVASSSSVDPTIGKEFFAKCMVASAFALLLMVIYIAFRFRKIGGWSAGVFAVVALVHDVIMVYATFVICQIPLNNNFFAVVLTIFGYSINDTIVIYDRIRENEKLYGSKVPFVELVNKSINQSFARSINTSISTIMALFVVAAVALIFNITSIWSFAFPMIIGMVSGCYSTLCITPTLWVTWLTRRGGKQDRSKAVYKKKSA